MGMLCGVWAPASTPLLLVSLLTSGPSSLFSLLLSSLTLASAETVAESSPVLSAGLGFGGATQRGISHIVPVKLFKVKPPLLHFRHGLPDRSRARSPALIAP
jgi:hypothetical protein